MRTLDDLQERLAVARRAENAAMKEPVDFAGRRDEDRVRFYALVSEPGSRAKERRFRTPHGVARRKTYLIGRGRCLRLECAASETGPGTIPLSARAVLTR